MEPEPSLQYLPPTSNLVLQSRSFRQLPLLMCSASQLLVKNGKKKKKNQSSPTKLARHCQIADQSQPVWQNSDAFLPELFRARGKQQMMIIEGDQNFIRGWRENAPKLNNAHPEMAGKGVGFGRNARTSTEGTVGRGRKDPSRLEASPTLT